jgi:hypothetical protein
MSLRPITAFLKERVLSSIKERSMSRVPGGVFPAPLRPGGAGVAIFPRDKAGRSRPAGGRP